MKKHRIAEYYRKNKDQWEKIISQEETLSAKKLIVEDNITDFVDDITTGFLNEEKTDLTLFSDLICKIVLKQPLELCMGIHALSAKIDGIYENDQIMLENLTNHYQSFFKVLEYMGFCLNFRVEKDKQNKYIDKIHVLLT